MESAFATVGSSAGLERAPWVGEGAPMSLEDQQVNSIRWCLTPAKGSA
jgi:hypothetical protein